MEGPPLGPGGEDITWPDQVAPRGRKASSTRKIKPQTSNLIVVYLFRSTDDVSLSLIPLVHVVDQEETGYGVGHRLSVSSPLSWGVGDAYDVCGPSMCPWDMGGGVGAHWGPPVLSSMISER